MWGGERQAWEGVWTSPKDTQEPLEGVSRVGTIRFAAQEDRSGCCGDAERGRSKTGGTLI